MNGKMPFQERGKLGGAAKAKKSPPSLIGETKEVDINEFQHFNVKPIVRNNTSTNRHDDKRYTEFEINIPIGISEKFALSKNTLLFIALSKVEGEKTPNGFIDSPFIRRQHRTKIGQNRTFFYFRITNPIARSMSLSKETMLWVSLRKATQEEIAELRNE